MPQGPKNPFTRDEESLLVKFLAKYRPNGQGRSGNNIYQYLCDDPEKKWKWGRTHSWQSWRNHYVKNIELFDRRIKKYQETHGIDSNASYSLPQKVVKKSPAKSEKQRIREEHARKRKREERWEDAENTEDEEAERVKRLKLKQSHKRTISVEDSGEEQEAPKPKPQPKPRPISTGSAKPTNTTSTQRKPEPQPTHDESSESEDDAPHGPVGSDDYQGDIFGEDDEAAEEEIEGNAEALEDEEKREEDNEVEVEGDKVEGEGEGQLVEEQEADGELDEVENMLSPEQDPIALPEDVNDVPRASATPGVSDQSEDEQPPLNQGQRLYPDLSQIPSPHLTSSMPNAKKPQLAVPGAFPTSTSTPAQRARDPVASSSKVKLDSSIEVQSHPPIPKPKPKPKPRKTDEHFFDSAPGTPQPESALQGHRAKLPQLQFGPYGNSFRKPAQMTQSDSEDEPAPAWPPRRRVVSGGSVSGREGQEKGKQKERLGNGSTSQSWAPKLPAFAQAPPRQPVRPSMPPGNQLAQSNTENKHKSVSANHTAASVEILDLTDGDPQDTNGAPAVADATDYTQLPVAKPPVPKRDIGIVRKLYSQSANVPSSVESSSAPVAGSAVFGVPKPRIPKSSPKGKSSAHQPIFKFQPSTAVLSSPAVQARKPSATLTSEDPFLSASLPVKRKASSSHPDRPGFALNKLRATVSTPSVIKDNTTPNDRPDRPSPYIDLRDVWRGSLGHSQSARRRSSLPPSSDQPFATPPHDQSFYLYSSAEKSHPRTSIIPKDEERTPALPLKDTDTNSNRRSSLLPFSVPERDSIVFEYLGASAAIKKLAEKYRLRDEDAERVWQHFRDLEKTEMFCKKWREKTEPFPDEIVEEMEMENKTEDVVMEEPPPPPPRRNLLLIQDRQRSAAVSELPPSSPTRRPSKEKQLEIKPLPSDDDISEYSAPVSSRAAQFNRLVKQGRREEALHRESRRASGIPQAIPKLGTPTNLGDSPTPHPRPPQPVEREPPSTRRVSGQLATPHPDTDIEAEQEIQQNLSLPRLILKEDEKRAFLRPDRRDAKHLQDIESQMDPNSLMSWISNELFDFRA